MAKQTTSPEWAAKVNVPEPKMSVAVKFGAAAPAVNIDFSFLLLADSRRRLCPSFVI